MRLFATATFTVASVLVLNGCSKKPPPAADFQGRIRMTVTAANAPPSAMTFEAASGSARAGVDQAAGSYALVRPDGMAVFVLDAQKAWSDLTMNKARAAIAAADPSGVPTVTKTGKHETIAGQDCELWDIRHTSGKRTEACIAENFVGFDFASLMPGAGSFGASPIDDGATKKKLFPLRSIEFDASGKESARMLVTTIERSPIDKTRFEVPPGYTYVPSK